MAATNQKTSTAAATDYGHAGSVVANDGTHNVMTFKMVVAADAQPVAEYFGFPMPRGTPFMHADGQNRVRVATNGRAVSCWMHGNQFGNGWCQARSTMGAAKDKFPDLNRGMIGPIDHTDAYERMRMFSNMNMLICQVGVAAGATGGDVMVVPFLQYDSVTDLGSDDW
jgi:hypothetical protein